MTEEEPQPLRLKDVVHEINNECLVGTGIVVTPDARVTIGRNDFGLREANVLKILAHEFRHICNTDVLCGYGRLP